MAGLCQDPFQRVTMIVRSTIDLAHNFGIPVVAEGIENEQVWRRLKQLDCTSHAPQRIQKMAVSQVKYRAGCHRLEWEPSHNKRQYPAI